MAPSRLGSEADSRARSGRRRRWLDGTGREPAHPGFAFAAPYQWLDSDTMAVLAVPTADEDGPISLLTCRVSTNACQVATWDMGTYGEVAVPDGRALGD